MNCLDKSEWLLPHSAPYRNRLKPLTTGTHIPCTQVVFLRLTFPLFPSWTLQEARLATAWGCEVGAGFPLQVALLSNGRPTLSFIAPSAKWGWQQQCRPHRVVMVLGEDDLYKIFSMNTECVIRVIHFYIAQILQTRRYSTFDMKMFFAFCPLLRSPPSLCMEQTVNQFSPSQPRFYFWSSLHVISNALDQLELASYNTTPGRKYLSFNNTKRLFFFLPVKYCSNHYCYDMNKCSLWCSVKTLTMRLEHKEPQRVALKRTKQFSFFHIIRPALHWLCIWYNVFFFFFEKCF